MIFKFLKRVFDEYVYTVRCCLSMSPIPVPIILLVPTILLYQLIPTNDLVIVVGIYILMCLGISLLVMVYETIKHTIEYTKRPTEKVQLAAVKESRWAIYYIDNPSEKVKALHLALWVL